MFLNDTSICLLILEYKILISYYRKGSRSMGRGEQDAYHTERGYYAENIFGR